MPQPPLVIPDIWEVVARGQMPNGDDYANVWFVEDSASVGFSSGFATQVINVFDAFFQTIKDRLSTGWGIQSWTVRDRSIAGGSSFDLVAATIGTDATEALPGQTALTVTWRADVNTRRTRGRTFLGGFTEAGNGTGGFPASALLADVNAAADTLIDDLLTEGFPLQVVSRGKVTTPPDPTDWDPFATPVVTGVADAYWDTMRRRGRP